MKLYEALALKTTLQTQLTQLISLRNRTYEYPEDEQPEFDFETLTAEIKNMVKKLARLKVEIARANIDTALSKGMSLFESILELQNLRSTVAQLQDPVHVGNSRFGMLGEWRTKKEEVKLKKQKDPQQLLNSLCEYQQRKNALDALIQQANHRIELPEL